MTAIFLNMEWASVRLPMKYRSRAEIIALILEAASNGATKTRLMYGAYLSYAQMMEYLELLLDNGLLICAMGEQKFKLTEKGLRYLHVYEKISELVSLPNATTSTNVARPATHSVAATVRDW